MYVERCSISWISTLFALLRVIAIGGVNAHMIMATPKPYGNPDNSPLSSSGSDFPCKVTGDPATFYQTAGIIDSNTLVAGEPQILSFTGSAVHGGGSCQLALTNDMQPSASTSWRVILSIESGCPSTDSTTPATYNYTIPADTEPGRYSFAWTWISKLAGQPEFYMNCAPVTVTAAASKPSKGLPPRKDVSYPELFVANLGGINSCKTSPGTDVVYPDPGPNEEKLLTGAKASFANISSDGCIPALQAQASGHLASPTVGAGAGSAPATTVPTQAADSPAPAPDSIDAVSSPTGMSRPQPSTLLTVTTTTRTRKHESDQASSVYVIPVTTGSVPSARLSPIGVSPTASVLASSALSMPLPLYPSSATSVRRPASASATPSATPLAPGSGSSNSTTGSGSSGGDTLSGKSGTCSQEGMFNCIGSDYQQCASGSWTAMHPLPAGTTCQQGESEKLWARHVAAKVNLVRRMRRTGSMAVD